MSQILRSRLNPFQMGGTRLGVGIRILLGAVAAISPITNTPTLKASEPVGFPSAREVKAHNSFHL